MGLADRVVPDGAARAAAVELAAALAKFPQRCLRADRMSAYTQWDRTLADALTQETRGGLDVITSGETLAGAQRFARGAGRHGSFD
jgi:enoyl-CoA hydratase